MDRKEEQTEIRQLRRELAREKARTLQAERNTKTIQRATKVTKAADTMQETGKALSGCGCLLTLFVTIPILILLFL